MKPLKILIVEDDAALATILGGIFQREGWQVSTAKNGPVAIEMAHREVPDAMVLDIMIPKIDGFEVCKTLRGDPKTTHIKIIMLTALSRSIDRDAARAAGAVDFITKPFDTQRLVQRIREVVRP